MVLKMRFLCYPEKKKFMSMGEVVKKEYELSPNAVDKIPSAYPCEKERLVVLATSVKGSKIPEDMALYIQDLNRARAANVAIVTSGDDTAVAKIKEILTAAGTNVIDDVYYTKTGLFDRSLSSSEKPEFLKWLKDVTTKLK